MDVSDENTGAIPFCFTHGTDWEAGCEGCREAQPVSAMADEHRAVYPRCRDWPLCGCGSEPTWYDDDYRREYEALAASLTFRSTEQVEGFLIDRWGDGAKVLAVVTIFPGFTYEQVQDRLPEWSALAYADPDPEPRNRLMQALSQGHWRAYKRLTM